METYQMIYVFYLSSMQRVTQNYHRRLSFMSGWG